MRARFASYLGLPFILLAMACSRRIDVAVMTKLEAGSLVGTSEVNAARLLLEDLGVRDVRVVPFDDAWDPAKAKTAFAAVRAAGIRYLVTSHTSACAMAIVDDIDAAGVLTIVTGAVTDALSGKDDWILRDIPDVVAEQSAIADWAASKLYRRIAAVRDTDNAAYTEPALRVFASSLPGREVRDIPFSIAGMDMKSLAASLAAEPYDLCYLLVGGYKSAAGGVAQLARSISPDCGILFTPWMNTPAIVETAGPALRGAWIPSHYPPRSKSPMIDAYIDRFKERFGYAPTYISLNVYRALEMLVRAFRSGARSPAAAKSYLVGEGSVETGLGSVVLDRYGDAKASLFMIDDIALEF
ncbi:MAG: ABC transporter substrate-binding protein [Spirochaetaceae bacterium]|nr:ABC transporter substrate-binding protein [Spirochaetaceae bacterium]